ncbi:MAG: GDSL-type esterase/lipase family protein [Halieaceae bacterium]
MIKRIFKYLLITLAILAVAAAWPTYKVYRELEKAASENPEVWEQDIARLEKVASADSGAVLFVGSSSIRLWSSLHEDMAPLVVVQRGFGGAKINDVMFYADRLFAADDPAAIVIFVGTNDISPGAAKQPTELLSSYRKMVAAIRKIHSDVPVYYVAITPSPLRWEVWPLANAANELIAEEASGDSSLHIIDTGPALLTNDKPNPDNYLLDGLHLSKSGYALWREIIRGRLLSDLAAP